MPAGTLVVVVTLPRNGMLPLSLNLAAVPPVAYFYDPNANQIVTVTLA